MYPLKRLHIDGKLALDGQTLTVFTWNEQEYPNTSCTRRLREKLTKLHTHKKRRIEFIEKNKFETPRLNFGSRLPFFFFFVPNHLSNIENHVKKQEPIKQIDPILFSERNKKQETNRSNKVGFLSRGSHWVFPSEPRLFLFVLSEETEKPTRNDPSIRALDDDKKNYLFSIPEDGVVFKVPSRFSPEMTTKWHSRRQGGERRLGRSRSGPNWRFPRAAVCFLRGKWARSKWYIKFDPSCADWWK